jgi:hypothetical protein
VLCCVVLCCGLVYCDFSGSDVLCFQHAAAVECYFREINWKRIFKGALDELQRLMASGQVSVGSSVSWWDPMPAIIRINVPVLGFLSHTVQESLLEKCGVIVAGMFDAHVTYMHEVFLQCRRAHRRLKTDHKQLGEYVRSTGGWSEYDSKCVLALVARNLMLSTDLSQVFFGNMLCCAFKMSTAVAWVNEVKILVQAVDKSEPILGQDLEKCWARVMAVDTTLPCLWANRKLLSTAVLIFRILLQQSGSASWPDIRANIGTCAACGELSAVVLCVVSFVSFVCCVMCAV